MSGLKDRTALADWAESEYKRLGIECLLERQALTRVREGLGGSHTVVTYPPLDALEPLPASEVLENVTPKQSINLYAHIAFCEHICPFCHYAKTYTPIGHEGKFVESYLQALSAEINHWQELIGSSSVSSIYIGGGTPTALSGNQLANLLACLFRFSKAEDLSICVETSPLTLEEAKGEKKLQILQSLGVTRLSMGIQTFDEISLRRTRGHGSQTAIRALETLSHLGIDYNIDLIQDLPFQNDTTVLNDLEWIERFRPPQVTWYVLRVHQESSWYRIYQRRDLELASPGESIRRRLLIREGMRRIGYLPCAGGRFVRAPHMRDRFKEIRSGVDSTLLGFGVSAYSHGWGYFFRNTSSAKKSGIRAYIEEVCRSGFGIESGLRLTPLEVTAGRIVSGLRAGVAPPKPSLGCEDYQQEAEATFLRLNEAGLVRQDTGGRWAFTETGWLFEEEICSLFYSSLVKARLAQRGCYWWTKPATTTRH